MYLKIIYTYGYVKSNFRFWLEQRMGQNCNEILDFIILVFYNIYKILDFKRSVEAINLKRLVFFFFCLCYTKFQVNHIGFLI